jgi:hypothetical protein
MLEVITEGEPWEFLDKTKRRSTTWWDSEDMNLRERKSACGEYQD